MAEELDRENLLHCEVLIWRGEEQDGPLESWGTIEDVCGALLKGFDDDDGLEPIDGMVIAVTRGLPEDFGDIVPTDPRSDT